MSEQRLNAIMEACGLRNLDRVLEPEQGNLNTVRFVKDRAGRELVLRVSEGHQRDKTNSYLQDLYNSMGLGRHKGRINFRTVPEQVRAQEKLSELGIRAPEVIDYGVDWMLISKVNGLLLKDLLGTLHDHSLRMPINAVLSAATEAHKKGVCLWDRWGANELVDQEGNISFIDFDVEVFGTKQRPTKSRQHSIWPSSCAAASSLQQIKTRLEN